MCLENARSNVPMILLGMNNLNKVRLFFQPELRHIDPIEDEEEENEDCDEELCK